MDVSDRGHRGAGRWLAGDSVRHVAWLGLRGNDGNLTPTGTNLDWNSFAPVTWQGTAPERFAEKNVSGWDFDGLEDAQVTTSDSGFAGGTKQDAACPTVITAKAPNKDDLKRAYFASKTDPTTGDIFLELAWVRIAQNTTSPSAHVAFEFNQSESACGGSSGDLVTRTAGDMLIVYDFEGGSTDNPTLSLSRWITSGGPCEVANNTPPCWSDAQPLSAAVSEARVNTSVVGPVTDQLAPPTPPTTTSTSQTLQLNEFGEAGINLTDAGVFTPGDCISFGNAYAVSRTSGSSSTAQMKDLVGPGNVNINNCGGVIIHKVTDPSPDETDTTFDYTTTGGLESGDPGFSLKDQESKDFGTSVQAGTYSVTETDPGPQFELTNIDCSASDLQNGSTVTPDLATGTVDIDLKALDTVDCTYTNTLQQGALAIQKDSTKGGAVSNAGAVFSYDGSSVTDNGTGDEDPAVGKVCVSGLDIGDYTVDETSPPPGYGDSATQPQTATVVSGSDCGANYPTGAALVTFTNPPLADIQVNFRDGGSGETSATSITCDNTGTTADTTPASGWDDSVTHEDISIDPSPRTVTCEIVIDP
jgi:hypothetical protein